MTPAALTPDYANSGAPGKRKTDRGVKRGAPVQRGPEGLNVDDKVRAAFRDSVTRYFAVNKKLDITDCYHKCLELHF
ncbi:MAG TPA: transposase, partial [Paracoccus sp. (in: a-proteobacteria)]|nr:transposase [Paracoccus sp. (in: a-proteobacteria)]